MFLLSMAEPAFDIGESKLEMLITQLARGKTDAMGPIYDMTSDSVYAFALSMLRNTHDAEDVMHDSYMRLFSYASGYTPQGKPMAFLLRITRNLCLDRIKERRRRAEVNEEDWEKLLKTEEFPTSIHAAEWMGLLKDDERQIVLMHAVSGFKHREIAQFMELPLATVLSKYSRAIKKLRKHIMEREESV